MPIKNNFDQKELSNKLQDIFADKYLTKTHDNAAWGEFITDSIKSGRGICEKIEHYASQDSVNIKRVEGCIKRIVESYLGNLSIEDAVSCQQLSMIMLYLKKINYDPNQTLALLFSEKPSGFVKAIGTISGPLTKIVDEAFERTNISNKNIYYALLLSLFSIIDDLPSVNISDVSLWAHKVGCDDPKTVKNLSMMLQEMPDRLSSIIKLALLVVAISERVAEFMGKNKYFGVCQRVINRSTGNVVYSFPIKNSMVLMRGNSNIIAGKANVERIEIMHNGDMLISYFKGMFFNKIINDKMEFNTALAISDEFPIILQLLDSICKIAEYDGEVNVFLERLSDNFDFVDNVFGQLQNMSSEICARIATMPSFSGVSEVEKERFLFAPHFVHDKKTIDNILEKINRHGYNVKLTLMDEALKHTRQCELAEGDMLFSEDDQPLFVYIPFDDGLRGHSKYSKVDFDLPAWVPVGHVGVIQGDTRKATIVAKKPVKVLMIPAETYASYWQISISESDLIQKFPQL